MGTARALIYTKAKAIESFQKGITGEEIQTHFCGGEKHLLRKTNPQIFDLLDCSFEQCIMVDIKINCEY